MATEEEIQGQIARLQSYLQMDPENIPLQLDIADLQHSAGQFMEAERSFNHVLTKQPGHEVASARLANVFISQLRFGEAEGILRSLTVDSAEAPVLNHNLGIALVYQNRWEEALEALQRASEGGVVDAENSFFKAYCLANLERREEAMVMAASALDDNVDDYLRGKVGLFQLEMGAIDLAAKTCEKLIQRQPRNIDANVVMASWNLEQQEIDSAERQINIVLDQAPNNPIALLGRALVQMYNQQTVKAIATFERTLALTPRAVGTWVALAWAHYANNDLVKAEAVFKKTLEIDRTFGEAHGGLAVIYALTARVEEARAAIARAKGLNQNSFGAAFAVSILLQQEGKAEVGARILTAAFRKSPVEDGLTVFEALRKYLQRQADVRGGAKPPPNRGPVKSQNVLMRF